MIDVEKIPAYCITLERRQDRWRNFMEKARAAHLQVNKWPGIDGRQLDIQHDERVSVFARRNIMEGTRRSHEEIDSIGAVGCALSHISLWKHMLSTDQEYFIIFEDDADLPADFLPRMKAIIASPEFVGANWDVWMLGGTWTTRKQPTLDSFYLIHAYVIRRSAAEAFVAGCYPIQAHIDHYMSMCMKMNGLTAVGSSLLRIKQTGEKSDIQMRPRCTICDVPTDVDKYYLLKKNDMAVFAAIVGTILIGATLF